MIKTTKILLAELADYSDPYGRIRRMCEDKTLYPIKRGWYTTDRSISPYMFASIIYSPSYLSFNFALSYYGLIPEAVYTYTSATYNNKNHIHYHNSFGEYSFRGVPKAVYPLEINIVEENGIPCFMASPEKAICDRLYELPPVKTLTEMELLLFDDLRVDDVLLFKLRHGVITQLSTRYRCNNIRLLAKLLRRAV